MHAVVAGTTHRLAAAHSNHAGRPNVRSRGMAALADSCRQPRTPLRSSKRSAQRPVPLWATCMLGLLQHRQGSGRVR